LKAPTLGGAVMRRLRAALVVPVVAFALYGAFKGVQLALDQPVRNLVVEGTFQRVTPIQVEAAVAEGLEAGFMTVNLSSLRERVQELDWVDRANVGRRWPDTLIVRVTEHQAAARWGERGLLNVRGELFTERSQHSFPELPSLAGPPGSERDVARRYLAVRGRLAEAGLTLESLGVDARGAWRIVLGGGQEIRLGRRDIDERLYRFFDVVAPALAADLKRVEYVDLRYTNGFAVGWRDSPPESLAAVGALPDRG
jgi:cell division protein FtsQ